MFQISLAENFCLPRLKKRLTRAARGKSCGPENQSNEPKYLKYYMELRGDRSLWVNHLE